MPFDENAPIVHLSQNCRDFVYDALTLWGERGLTAREQHAVENGNHKPLFGLVEGNIFL